MPRPQTCSRCGQEVRYGARNGVVGWLHREDADHFARFGAPVFEGMSPEEIEAYFEGVRATRRAAQKKTDDDDTEEPLPEDAPEPEVRAIEIQIAPKQVRVFLAGPDGILPLDIPGGLRTVRNAARKTGWDMRVTYARGPWMHASYWRPTGIVDHYVLRLRRGPERAVLTWRDGKAESSWYWRSDVAGSLEKINSKDLRERIKQPC